MADLKNLQDRLRADPQLRTKFVQDPGSVLAAEGVQLSPEMLNFLQQQLAAKNLAGGVMPPDANAVSVGITVGN